MNDLTLKQYRVLYSMEDERYMHTCFLDAKWVGDVQNPPESVNRVCRALLKMGFCERSGHSAPSWKRTAAGRRALGLPT